MYEAENEKGEKFAIKQYNLQTAYECFRNEYILGERFFYKGGIKNKISDNGMNQIIEERRILFAM